MSCYSSHHLNELFSLRLLLMILYTNVKFYALKVLGVRFDLFSVLFNVKLDIMASEFEARLFIQLNQVYIAIIKMDPVYFYKLEYFIFR